MTSSIGVTNCDAIKFELNLLHDTSGLSWGKIAKMSRFLGVPPGTLYRIATTNYEPKRPEIRKILGLPIFALAPVCPVCGVVHVAKRCTEKTKPARKRRSHHEILLERWAKWETMTYKEKSVNDVR
jgi:hypothetical protein